MAGSFCKAGPVLISLFCCVMVTVHAQDAPEETFWDRISGEVFAGFNQSKGNTDQASGSVSAKLIKKYESSRFELRGSAFYSESSGKKEGQRWKGSARYSCDLGPEGRWYVFCQTLLDHDRQADIRYRVRPAAGLGYHIFRRDDIEWDVHGGLGYRITRHRDNKDEDDEFFTAVTGTNVKWRVFRDAVVSQELTYNPGFESGAGYLLRSESALTNPLTCNLHLEVKYIINYDSEPAENKKTTDTQFIAGLKYTF